VILSSKVSPHKVKVIVILTSTVSASISFLPEFVIVVNLRPTRIHPYHGQSSNFL